MLLPLTSQDCCCCVLIIFMVVGFMRGWGREVISLVFILLAVCLVHPDTSDAFNCFLGRSGSFIAYVSDSSQLPTSACYSGISFLRGAFWSFLIFVLLVTLGYCIGNRICPEPRCLQTRFFGILPAVVSGTILLFYLCFYMKAIGGPNNLQVNLQQLNPSSFVPVICVILIITLIFALVVSCCKK
jgi:hypothetical protein